MLGQDSAHDIIINIKAKGVRDLLRDACTAETGISVFHLDNKMDDFLGRSLRTWLTVTMR